MPQTQHVKAAEILYDPPVLTSSWNSRTAPKPDGIPRRGAAGPKAHDSLKNDLGAQIPRLRAFAISLCGSMTLADDLVQEALLRAWANSEKFQPGTNLRAWLFTILRNVFYSQHRKRSREVQEDSDGEYSRGIAVAGNQESHLDLADVRIALAKLPAEQREVLILVGASGASYAEAAVICGVETGTIKSRLSRARAKLSELMGLDDRPGARMRVADGHPGAVGAIATSSALMTAAERRRTADRWSLYNDEAGASRLATIADT
jgi:RNA polymerase sigma-70 factor (ECF subfamily)